MKTDLESLTNAALLCYAYGHQWDTAGGLMLVGGFQEDHFRCGRGCGCTKREVWSRATGRTWGRAQYSRPPSYRLGYRVSREDAKIEVRARGLIVAGEMQATG